MRNAPTLHAVVALVIFFSTATVHASGSPVVATHPRVLLTPAITSQLEARKSANDPRWLNLKARADVLKTYSIFPYKWATRTTEPLNTIFYDYQGEGWESAALPLALAYHMTGDTSYSNKLFALTDEMIRAQNDPDNKYPNGFGPLVPGNYYSTRSLGHVLAVTFDWCYNQLGSRKAGILALMNAYYDEIRDSAYQRNERADGNYFVGHLFAVAMMGYASYGDNPKAQEMIDWARIRFDGTPSTLIDAGHTPEDFFSQLFEGGTRPQVAREYLGPHVVNAPFKGGIDFQGWAYAGGTYNRIIDYMLTVKSATGEDLIATRGTWLSQILRALKHSMMPNRFEVDPSGDFGSDWGAVMGRSLPVRLAYALAGTPDGPGAQNFAYSEIAKTSPYPEFPDYIYLDVYQPTEWEDFFFTDTTRASSELVLPPYYSGFAPVYPQGNVPNEAIPYFFMRSDWSTSATWASIRMGTAFFDDHQHSNAGHLFVKRGNDYLAIDASNWKGATGSIGIVGSSLDEEYGAGAAANTLFFDDYGDYQYDAANDSRIAGGQGTWGKDEVIAAEQNDNFSYIRSDLSTAYNHGGDTTDPAVRKLEYFYRNFAYLRQANVFVVFDQTKALASSNPRGEYRKHIRWHFPNRPTVAGTTLKVEQGASRLNMAFILPEAAAINAVDEMHNPDPCDGKVSGCTPYDFNSGTWRVEVSDPAASRTTPFLAVLQPTSLTDQPMISTKITSNDATMIGAKITTSGKGSYVMLFNNGAGQTPAPITSVSYSGAADAVQTLAGMKPSTKYSVVYQGTDQVTVTESASGTYTTSAGGVLQFGATSGVTHATNHALLLEPNYPNPFGSSTLISFVLPRHAHVTLTLCDALGRTIKTLADADLEAGNNSVELSTDGLPNGIYNYTLRSNDFSETRQCVVMK